MTTEAATTEAATTEAATTEAATTEAATTRAATAKAVPGAAPPKATSAVETATSATAAASAEATLAAATHEAEQSGLPDYAAETNVFHQAFANELRAAVGTLPLSPTMRVIDLCCGDGFYTRLLAERIVAPGEVIGLDRDLAYLATAAEEAEGLVARCPVRFRAGELAALPPECRDCDLVWLAQSLYSLPEPVTALRQMAAAAKPGGLVAVLENDTLHQLLLPWPERLEIALRSAEFLAFAEESSQPAKFYVGRRLPMVFAEAGLEPLGFRTQCIDRQAPLDPLLEAFLQSYLARLAERVSGRLDPRVTQEFAELIDPNSARYLLRQPHFTMSWLNVLTWGRRPL